MPADLLGGRGVEVGVRAAEERAVAAAVRVVQHHAGQAVAGGVARVPGVAVTREHAVHVRHQRGGKRGHCRKNILLQ